MPHFLQKIVVVTALLSAALLSGCATIIKGTHQTIPVSSDPSGASVVVDGQRQGSTPLTVSLSRKQAHLITVELSGYEVENINLKPSIGGAVAGNIVAGGLIGWGVDASTGAQYNLHPDTVDLKLRRVPTAPENSASKPQPTISQLIAEIDSLDKLRNEGKISQDEYSKTRVALLQRYQQ